MRYLREVQADDVSEFEVGQEVNVDMFEVGEKVDVIGTTKGRGFAGSMKRWGFAGGPRTHGQSDRARAPGKGSWVQRPSNRYARDSLPGRSIRVFCHGMKKHSCAGGQSLPILDDEKLA